MSTAHVTFVIATYNRVDALRHTIRSVLRQEHGNWTALVVGDHCRDETAEAIRAFRDPRLRYYNLPMRCGEQAGPNSVGLQLAGGDFVAFLNHDDLLLPDHLGHGLERLAGERAEFFVGRFANATRVERTESGVAVPVFTHVRPRHLELSVLLQQNPWAFEPSSFWLVRTAYARAVGPWRTARELWRTPLRDWILRAWRRGGRFCAGTRMTGLRFLTHKRDDTARYSVAAAEHDYMASRMEREPPDATRAFLRAQLRREIEASAPATHPFEDALRPPWRRMLLGARRGFWSAAFRYLGVDRVALAGRLRRRERGEVMDTLSRLRTGTPLPAQPTIAELLRDPDSYRVI